MPGRIKQAIRTVMRGWSDRRRIAGAAESLYGALVAQARLADFYRHGGIADTVDGRFDLITLHAFLVMRRLKAAGPDGTAAMVSQGLFDHMFRDMDRSLREMGVGDLSVGKKVRAMTSAFYGRIKAYEEAVAAGDGQALKQALARNVYRGLEPSSAQMAALAGYVRRADRFLADQPLDRLVLGQVDFPPVLAPPPDRQSGEARPGETG